METSLGDSVLCLRAILIIAASRLRRVGYSSNQPSEYKREASSPNGPLLDSRLGRKLESLTNPEGLGRINMGTVFRRLWSEEEGQDIAEYAVMLAVILVIVVGTVRLIGGNANNVFSGVASSIGS
jgi:Flp pilus assembly pilin Flp